MDDDCDELVKNTPEERRKLAHLMVEGASFSEMIERLKDEYTHNCVGGVILELLEDGYVYRPNHEACQAEARRLENAIRKVLIQSLEARFKDDDEFIMDHDSNMPVYCPGEDGEPRRIRRLYVASEHS